MTHPSDDSLILYLLGDEEDRAGLGPHVDGCQRCRREIERLRGVLQQVRELPVPEPDADFEERVWARQREALLAATGAVRDRSERAVAAPVTVAPSSLWRGRRMVMAAALAASLAIAFLAGLYAPRQGNVPADAAAPATSRDRVLLVAVGDHLERTRMVLVELANASDPDAFNAQRVNARSLIGDNRLYRQTAQLSGQPAVAEVLDEVERVLLEVARSSDEIPADELAWLRQRISDRDLLFKVSVIEEAARPDAERPRAGGPSL